MNLKDKIAIFRRRSLIASGMFDRNHYQSVYSDIAEHKIDPFRHYFEHGIQEGRQPNALFDPKYYRKKYLAGKHGEVALFHYLSKEGWKNSPHPLFDVDYYVGQLSPEERKPKCSYLEHYLKEGWKKGYSPTPYFDPDFYLRQNADVAREKVNPLIHYLTFGEKEGRAPSLFFEPNLFKKPPRSEEENYAVYHAKSKLEYYAVGQIKSDNDFGDFIRRQGRLERNKPIIIYVSHEGTRTGAPLIVLEIARRFQANYDIQPINILLRGGELTPDFDELGPTYVALNFRTWPERFYREMLTVLSKIDTKDLIAVVVNSAESREIMPFFRDFGVPVIALVHEFAEFYPPESWKVIDEHADVIVFPSKVVQEKAIESNTLNPYKLLVRGQGLLNERFLRLDREESRQEIRARIPGMGDNTIIVLGCGTADPRKGVDFFVNIGLSYLASRSDEEDVLFVWLGKEVDNEHLRWSQKDIKRAGQEDRILFIGPATDPAPFFVGSDVFLMTSRADPFPCVVHEAMASRLPIVGFEGGGGFVEALENEAGVILPYGDFYGAILELNKLVHDERYRWRIGANARQRLLEKYDFRDYSRFIIQLIFKATSSEKRLLLNHIPAPLSSPPSETAERSRKSVIFTLPSWEAVSGVNTFVENLILELRKHGYDAYILFTYVRAETFENDEGVILPKVPYRFLNNAKDDRGYECQNIWKSLKAYLELNSPCLFVPNYDYIASAVSADLSNEVGILGVLHSDDVEHYEHAYRLGRYWNHTVSVSQLIHDKLMALNPILEKRSSIIHYGVDTPVHDYELIKKADSLTMVYVGRIIQHQKRILDFIEIVEKLDKQYSDFVLTFIGTGPESDALEAGLSAFIELGKVRILGRQDKEVIYEELARSHAFLLFSDFEGLPLSVLEAISMACVPVLTDIESGIKEIIKHEKNGLISPRGDIDLFVQQIVRLATDDRLRERLSKNAFSTLLKHGLTKELMGEKYKMIIQDIFLQIESKNYQRPPALAYGTPYGGILIPPGWQEVKRNIL